MNQKKNDPLVGIQGDKDLSTAPISTPVPTHKDSYWKDHSATIGAVAVIVALYGFLWNDLSDELEGIRSDMTTEFGSVRSEFSSVRSEFSSVRSEISSVRSEISSVRSEFGNELRSVRDEIKGVREEVNTLARDVGRLEGKIAESIGETDSDSDSEIAFNIE